MDWSNWKELKSPDVSISSSIKRVTQIQTCILHTIHTIKPCYLKAKMTSFFSSIYEVDCYQVSYCLPLLKHKGGMWHYNAHQWRYVLDKLFILFDSLLQLTFFKSYSVRDFTGSISLYLNSFVFLESNPDSIKCFINSSAATICCRRCVVIFWF